jgi:hypothetical protein
MLDDFKQYWFRIQYIKKSRLKNELQCFYYTTRFLRETILTKACTLNKYLTLI